MVLAVTGVVPGRAGGDLAAAQSRGRIVLVGDSIMLGAAPQIDGSLRSRGFDVVVDAAENRSTRLGADVLAGLLVAPADAAVVMLGANDAGDPAAYRGRVESVVAAAGAVPHLYWMTIPEVRDYYPAANQVVRDVAATRPGMQVLPWAGVTAADPSLTARDGLHLTPSGSVAMAFFVTANVEAGLAPPTTAPPAPTPSAPSPTEPAPAGEGAAAGGSADPVDDLAARSAEGDDGGTSPWLVVGGSFGLVLAVLAGVGLALAAWALWRTRKGAERS